MLYDPLAPLDASHHAQVDCSKARVSTAGRVNKMGVVRPWTEISAPVSSVNASLVDPVVMSEPL